MALVTIISSSLNFKPDLSRQECRLVNHTTTRPNNMDMTMTTLKCQVKTTAALC